MRWFVNLFALTLVGFAGQSVVAQDWADLEVTVVYGGDKAPNAKPSTCRKMLGVPKTVKVNSKIAHDRESDQQRAPKRWTLGRPEEVEARSQEDSSRFGRSSRCQAGSGQR